MSIEQQSIITTGEDYSHPASTFEDRLSSFKYRNREMLFNINGIYEEALDYISRYADLQDEQIIRNQLKTNISESYVEEKTTENADSSTFKADRDMYRDMYWAHLEAVSMNPVIQDILQSEQAQEAYQLGYNGGNEKDKYSQEEINENLYDIYKEAADVLFNMDPRLANKKKLYNTFVDQSLTTANSHRVTFEILENLGMGIDSPEGKIGLLSHLYLHEKRDLYSQLTATIKEFKARSGAKIFSQKVSLAHMKQNAIEEVILNFEKSRGYLDLVKDAMQANLEQIPVIGNTPEEQAKNRHEWLNSFHLGLFLRIRDFEPDEGKRVRSKIFSLVNKQRYDEVKTLVSKLATDHPNMYADFMWKSLGVNIQEIRKEREEERLRQTESKKGIKQERNEQAILARHEEKFAENEAFIEQIPAEVFNRTVQLPDGTKLTIYEPRLQKKGGIKGSKKAGEVSHAPQIRYIPFCRYSVGGYDIGHGTRSAKSILEFLKDGYKIIED